MSYKVKIELNFDTYKPNEDDIFTYIRELYEDNSLDYELIDNKNRKDKYETFKNRY
jgi:hypothetical protein|tara:strand:- start:439 stop:606 length:168 start_codon:yes stop_codon:yes gene_type:complete